MILDPVPVRARGPRSCAILAAIVAAWLPFASAACAESSSEIYLTWHAPWGSPGASDTLTTAECDTTRNDTLWLAFRPAKTHPSFIAFEATLLFHPTAGESLSGWWYEILNDGSPTHMWMQFHPQPSLGYPQPFAINGAGAWRRDTVGATSRIRVVYAVPYTEAVGIRAQTMVAGRILLHRPPPRTRACREPVCIEWADSRLSYQLGPDFDIVETGAHRFVSLNSPGGEIMLPFRRAARVRGWKPKG